MWCKECDPFYIIEGWTSGNFDIDKFIKDSMYNARNYTSDRFIKDSIYSMYISKKVRKHQNFLEWIPFDRLIVIEQIGEGGFSEVYSAIWIDGISKYIKQAYGSWEKSDSKPIKVALKRLNGSQDMSATYLNEVLLIFISYIYFINEISINCHFIFYC